VNSATHMIYIANAGYTFITIIDGTTLQSFNLDGASNTVSVIDDTLQTKATIPVGNDPVALATDVVNGEVYVVNRLSKTVSLINLDNGVQTVAVGGMPRAE